MRTFIHNNVREIDITKYGTAKCECLPLLLFIVFSREDDIFACSNCGQVFNYNKEYGVITKR